MTDIVGINWGSTAFRAYRIAPDGAIVDEWTEPAGVLSVDRGGMAALMEALRARWPDVRAVYASGMIGSDVGWTPVPYLDCPAGLVDVAAALTIAQIGPVTLAIVPGLACRRAADSAPDVLRGEEMELFGLLAGRPVADTPAMTALPGTHTKWACHRDGRLIDFMTGMGGEMYDRLTEAGLLASLIEGEATDSAPFREGVRRGHARMLGLGALLFGARASVLRGELLRRDAASYLRGLLIGADIADACGLYPDLARGTVALVGNQGLATLYATGLRTLGIAAEAADGRRAVAAGYAALHRLAAIELAA